MGNTISSPTKAVITRLIMYPVIITLVVTLLRLFGELMGGPAILFGKPDGTGAIVGITWLPFIFGPYFAVKLFDRSMKPTGFGKTIIFALVGFVILAFGGILAFTSMISFTGHIAVGLLLFVVAAGLQYIPWHELAQTLIAYGYLARVPVAIVMYFAMRGNWHTHYNAHLPGTEQISFWTRYLYIAVAPQLVMWIAFTMTVGALFGGIYAAIVRRK
jgi:hypothetical protein